ncbi:hypothetical protein [Bradyrhizobium japonicum]|uniref:hypothetical protein n=1 Tax=Bradyrhizobium japonicum TaxID=375 RepID=UPI002011CCEE|nr:hypothetical protein [Bradyrhizobium japonicum]
MAHFTVHFLKDVLGDQGQPCEADQRVIDVMRAMQLKPPRWPRNSSANSAKFGIGRCMLIALTCSRLTSRLQGIA